jgi:hypothetical protein
MLAPWLLIPFVKNGSIAFREKQAFEEAAHETKGQESQLTPHQPRLSQNA